MNKQDLILQVANKIQLTQTKSEQVISTALEAIMKTLSKGDKVTLVGFGTFEPRKRKERRGRNPKTGEEIQIPSSVVPKFSAGKTFKQTVNRR